MPISFRSLIDGLLSGKRTDMPSEPPPEDRALVVPGAPSDNDDLTTVLEELGSRGYDDNVFIVGGGRVKWGSCGHTAAAADLVIDDLRRMEGASDPDDMVAVYAVRCSSCDARGTLVLSYGPTASEEESDVLVALPEHRASDRQ